MAPMNRLDENRPGISAAQLNSSYGTVQAVRGIDLAIAPGAAVSPRYFQAL
jgi:ABC-type Fe3+/spermidine/putrescine transport system ATPase subunit